MNLALFDLDNTLLAGDSDFEWGQFLISRGIVDPELQAAKNAAFYADYKAGTLDIEAFMTFQMGPLSHHSRTELNAWHAEFMDQHIRPMIAPGTRALLAQHANDLCVIITATNSFVTGPIARELGVPHLIASIPAIDRQSGRFTGSASGSSTRVSCCQAVMPVPRAASTIAFGSVERPVMAFSKTGSRP